MFGATAAARLAASLVACGETPDAGIEVAPPVPPSPTAGEIPAQTFMATAMATAAVTPDAFDPNRFIGQIETAFALALAGDGAEHTLVIEGMVAETAILAEGATSMSRGLR
jgi:hypothetical protein